MEGKLTVFTRNSVTEAGNYTLVQGDSILGVISFNFNRNESDPAVMTESDILKSAEQAGLKEVKLSDGSNSDMPAEMILADQGKQFWKLFIILALLFLAIEILLIRLK
jgi:hypothetical protein